MRKEIIACWLLMIVGCTAVAVGLYSIRDKHYGVTNICNEQFYPDLCGKTQVEEKKE
jgi:hypothetical protein